MRFRTTRPSRTARLVRRAAAAVASASLVCAPIAVTTAAPPPAHAAPSPGAASSTQADPATPEFLALSIDSVSPTAVRSDGPATVTVGGTVRNVGDRTVSDVQVRLQRAPRVTAADQVRSVLSLDQSSYGTVGMFHTVADALDTGQSARFTLSMPIDDPTAQSLAITEPGVYPMLVNVNGTPDYGGRARLDDARFLLPVLSLPARATTAPQQQGPTTPHPVPMTLLLPVAAQPELAAGFPGQPADGDARARLVGDALASSLAPGGRLDGMLSALTEAFTPENDPQGALAQSSCLAVDPDLLVTVDAMTRGYTVSDDPSDPDTEVSDGGADESSGQAAAAAWLRGLRGLAAHMCTVALPYAQADLDAVRTLASPEVTDATLAQPADLVDGILGVHSVRGLVWPGTGQLTPATAGFLAADPAAGGLTPASAEDTPPAGTPAAAQQQAVAQAAAMIASNTVASHTVAEGAGSGDGSGSAAPSQQVSTPDGAVRVGTEPAGSGLGAMLFDMPAAAALAAVGSTPTTPSYVPDELRFDLDHDSPTARLQDALGAIAWPLLQAHSGDGGAAGGTGSGAASSGTASSGTATSGTATPSTSDGARPKPLVLAPPQDWSADHDETARLLAFLERSLGDGLATPQPLAEAIDAARAPEAPAVQLTDPRPGDGVADLDGDDAAGQGTSGPLGTGDGTAGFTWNSAAAVPPELVTRLGHQLPRLATLGGMLTGPGTDGATPAEFMAPLYQDIARTVSTAGRNGDQAAQAAVAADDRATALRISLDDQFSAVSVLAPGSVYTLASSQSPLLVVAKNDLPVPVTVGLQIFAPAGVQIGSASDYVLPARGSRQIQIPAQIEFSRQIDLRVQLLAPDSTPLGEQVHISLHSNAYGMVIPVITGIFGALLLFLAGRRGWHRLRGQHDPADDRASERGPVLEEYRDDVTHRGPEDEA